MNAKEKARLRRLEIENQNLREQIDRHFVVYRDQTWKIVEMQTKLEMITEALNLDIDQ